MVVEMLRWRSVWTFLVTERAGYRRPSPVTDFDHRLYEQASARFERLLKRSVRLLDADLDLLRLERESRGGQS